MVPLCLVSKGQNAYCVYIRKAGPCGITGLGKSCIAGLQDGGVQHERLEQQEHIKMGVKG